MSEIIEQFRDAMVEHGLDPGAVTVTGNTFHRFPTNGNSTDKPGFYQLADDGPHAFGCFGNWSTGLHVPWTSKNTKTMSPAERAEHDRRVADQRKRADQEREKVYQHAAAKARKELSQMTDCTDHPYLAAKSVKAVPGLKLSDKGLVVPVFGPDNKIQSYQRIYATDRGFDKRFMPGGRTWAGWFKIDGSNEVVCICEGLATGLSIHAATGFTVIVAFSGGNLVHVAKLAKAQNIIICADNDRTKPDNPGLEYAEKAAQATGARLAVPVMPAGAQGTDFNDLATISGPDAVREIINRAVSKNVDSKTDKKRLTFSPASELTGVQEPTSWLIKSFLEAGTLSCVFGPPESLKTFVVTDLGFHVAAGMEWHGQRVEGGNVLYLCGEGRRPYRRRISVLEIRHGIKADRFFVSSGSAALLDPAGLAELESAADEISEKHGNPSLIIVDTLNRNFGPGDENNTTDMTKFIIALDRLRERFKCAILIVHHTGLQDTGRGRGNSALRGALDFEYSVTRKGTGIEDTVIKLSCSKCKDHDRPPTIAFKPVVVDLGLLDEDLQPVTSLVLDRTEYTPQQRKEKKLSPAQWIALEALRSACRGSDSAHLDKWRAECYATGISDSEKGMRMAFSRARTALLEAGLITTRDDQYSIADAPSQSVTKHNMLRQVTEGESVTERNTPLKGCYGVTPSDANQVRIEI